MNYSEDDLVQEYIKAVDLLTINETNRLRKKVDILKEKEHEIKMLKERLSSYELQAMQIHDVTVKLQQRMDKLDDVQKLTDYGSIPSEKLAATSYAQENNYCSNTGNLHHNEDADYHYDKAALLSELIFASKYLLISRF